MEKTLLHVAIVLPLLTLLAGCGEKAKGPKQSELTNEQKIEQVFATFVTGYQNRDITTIMSTISENYHDSYNSTRGGFRTWLQNFLSGWQWTDSLAIAFTSDIKITQGYLDPYQNWHPTSAIADVIINQRAKNTSEGILMSSVANLISSWELEETTVQWSITRLSGPTVNVGTSPISVSSGSTVNVVAYTLPYGAPLQNYDTKSVDILDWNSTSIPVADQGDKKYVGSFTAPLVAGEYTLNATLSDSTHNQTITLTHTFTVE